MSEQWTRHALARDQMEDALEHLRELHGELEGYRKSSWPKAVEEAYNKIATAIGAGTLARCIEQDAEKEECACRSMPPGKKCAVCLRRLDAAPEASR